MCDSKGKIFAVVLGWPEGWACRTEGANRVMERLQAALAGCKAPPNRRGPFAAYAVGYSYGGGQTVCDLGIRELDLTSAFLPATHAIQVYETREGRDW